MKYMHTNPATNTWSEKADYAGMGRVAAASFVLDGKIYVGNGRNGTTFLKDWWAFNPASGTWSELRSIPDRQHTARQDSLLEIKDTAV
jgi:N-acetylneuraminic acid mutarotase